MVAIFAVNDEKALGALCAFRECGIGVPDDVAVLGFDDVAGSAHFDPPLTTVRPEFGALGALAVRGLRDLLATGGGRLGSPKIRPSLVVREGSGGVRESPVGSGSRWAARRPAGRSPIRRIPRWLSVRCEPALLRPPMAGRRRLPDEYPTTDLWEVSPI